MNYKIFILRRAQKELSRLADEHFHQIKEVIRGLAHNPRPPGCRKLTNRTGWRIKIGPYRIIYELDDTIGTITILNIGHRRDIYR